MNRDDLLKMLDLSGKERIAAAPDELSISPHGTKPNVSASPTALEVDEWGLRRGRELLAESERLEGLNLNEAAIADFHTAAFHPEPLLRPDCMDAKRHEFLTQMLETPEYKSLHTSTLLDDTAAAIAATSFAEQFAALKKEDDEKQRSGTAKADALSHEMATLRAVGRALTTAREEVHECREVAAALGLGPGAPGANDPHAVAAIFRRVREHPNLRRICELAGRYRRFAQSRQRRKTKHGLDDVVGVELGGDLGRLLPSELARLSVPEFEWDTLRRIAERQAMCREHHASEPVAKGPIIIALDESGSMAGDKIHTAKALALALAWVARQQRRWIGLVAYSGDTGERLLPLPPGRWNEADLMDWLCEFLGRGSTLDVPVREMPGYYEKLKAPVGHTDLIFITDCQCQIPDEVKKRFLDWKAAVSARLITLVIGASPGDLAEISDEVHLVSSLDVTEAAVERVVSI